MKKDKKEKIVYYDDGRTLADMSDVTGGSSPKGEKPPSSFSDVWHTYWSAVKMMFLPMLAVIGCLIVVYLIAALLFYLA